MKKTIFLLLFSVFLSSIIYAQSGIVKGIILDSETQNPLVNVTVTVTGTAITQETDANGNFILNNVPDGNQLVQISFKGYESQSFPISISDDTQEIDLGTILLFVDLVLQDNGGLISLSEDELNDDSGGADNISGLLSSSRDVFSRTAAFEFSSSFFRVRGLDSDNAKVLINGVEMNKVYNGRPQWSNWGGLNDVLRNQELTTGLAPSSYTFGGVLGSTNINTRASEARAGSRITYSSSNRSYANRVMASHASGMTKSGWAYTFSAGRRWGEEGYLDATSYNANSFFVAIEKKLNDNHSLNFTGIYASNRRGKSSPNTQEVFDLKDRKYNEYWGYQNGEKRNSRIKEIEEPILMLNHYWSIGDKTTLNTNVAYQFGKLGNSRLDYNGNSMQGDDDFAGGGANPSPAYYQLLPSYLLRNFPENPEFAFGAQQKFINDGQIDWNALYETNIANANEGKYASYILYEDRVDDTQLTLNTILNTEINDNITINAAVNYQKLESENFAEVLDLLGGTGYLNVDGFDGVQFDLQNPNQIAGVGDRFRYNYNLYADILNGFVQAQFKYNKIDFYIAGSVTNTDYQREGLYQSETFENNSFGNGEKLSFTGFGSKGGFTYKITGKHLIDVNASYAQRAPSLRNTYSNSRSNHNVVPDIIEEKITSFDANYIFRSPIVKAKLSGFYTKSEDANEISFFFADGIQNVIATNAVDSSTDESSNFIQEILQGIDKRHVGAELGIEAQVTPTIKLKAAGSYGQYTYDNDPNLYLSADNFDNFLVGKSSLKDYRIAGGPQKAYSFGFEYRDPNYWWFGATANFFDDTYIDVSPLTRSSNFYTDTDGLPFNDYDEVLARELLEQEKFDNYLVVNLTGGKSWKIDDYYVGFFASIGNVFDEKYRTGGFEQGRNANFRQLRDDKALETPVFGPKYWYGRGANYFVNIYFRF